MHSVKKTLFILLTLICFSGYSQNLTEIQNHLLQIVNEERRSRNLTPFEIDEEINLAAKIQADYLRRILNIRQVSHTNPNPKLSSPSHRIKVGTNSKYRSSGENITAFTYDETKTSLEIAQHAHDNFMNSRGHRTHIIFESFTVFDDCSPPTLYYGHYVEYNKKLNMIIVVQMFPSK